MNEIKSRNKMILADNQAFTLIEMIIGLAIASFVALAVFSFISVGTRSYESANQNTKLQGEMQLTNNYMEGLLMEGSVEQTKYVDNGNIKMLYIGNKVLYYNQGLKKFAIYEASETLGTDLDGHLITNCMSSFKVEFMSTEPETTLDDEETSEIETTTPEPGVTYASSNMVKITSTYTIKKQKLTSEKIYMIRNK